MLTFPPDITFVIQLVSFFILLGILNRLMFAPFGALLAERTERTEGAATAAAHDQSRAEAIAREIEIGLAESRGQAAAEAEAIRRDARAQEAGIFNQAKTEASDRLAGLRRDIEKEREAATVLLREDAKTLAQAMVGAVLRPVGSTNER